MLSRTRPARAALTNWIAGQASAGPGATLPKFNPATGELAYSIPRSGAAEVGAAVDAASAALRGEWAGWTLEERVAACLRVADVIEGPMRDEFVAAESQDCGKPLHLAAGMDIARSVANFRFFANAVQQMPHAQHPMSNALNYTHRTPVGVAALITPWNLPLYLLSWKVAPAMVMGNTMVAKPSELTPHTATLLGRAFREAGVPDGVYNVVHGLGAEVGEPLIGHPEVKAVSFTGGTATGARVAAVAAPAFKKLSLELGGKNPTIVFADADLAAAAKGAARAAFLNSGQICLCGSRLLVQREAYDEFVPAFVAEVERLRVGAPEDAGADLGSLVSAEHRDKVEGYIALAQTEGGRVLTGGARPEGLPPANAAGAFLRPTVIADLPTDSRTATEEIFGPVVTVHPFDSEEDALAAANCTRYGLAASVWTRDVNRAHLVAQRLETGMVWVNSWLVRDLRVPFGGVKDSGVGREGGFHSLSFMSEEKNICISFGDQTFPGQSAMPSQQSGGGGGSRRGFHTSAALLGAAGGAGAAAAAAAAADGEDDDDGGVVNVAAAPKPVGAYPHARRVGDLLFLSGIGPRTPGTDAVPGGPIHDADGNPLEYDVAAQTHSVIRNVKTILEASGSSLDKVVDVQVFLIDMKRDFAAFNAVYAEYFTDIQATRTTCAIRALPTPIAVEFKIIALAE